MNFAVIMTNMVRYRMRIAGTTPRDATIIMEMGVKKAAIYPVADQKA